ncbi:MAG TPA: carbohydrate-binding module family 20 domain-containing protein, partial [Candidatus Binatia bacterium]|nr:carbohydrate-binding module family 20 domain-containing protein [Candidatus Binatia bacterium]
MTVIFRLRFSTRPGQSLWLTGNHPLPPHPVPLEYIDPGHWQVSVPLTAQVTGMELNYSYILRQSDGSQSTDWGQKRKLVPAGFNSPELLVVDSWNHPGFYANAFYTAPFKNVLLAENPVPVPARPPSAATHTFRVKSPLLAKGQTVCLLGESPLLGQWNTSAPVLLNRRVDEDYFSVTLDLRGQRFPFAYKYGVFDVGNNRFVRFEGGSDRILSAAPARNQHTLVNDGFTVLPDDTWHGAGVAVPV